MKNIVFVLTAAISFVILATGCNGQVTSGNNGGTAWGSGSFSSNGQRIYFTGTSESNSEITYTDGPVMGMMMMGGRLACVSCHGINAEGGRHMMHMEIMDAPDIRWSALTSGHHDEEMQADQDHQENYDFEDFKNSVENGKHPDGDNLSTDMPRWRMSDADLRDLMNYLKTLK